MKVAVCHVAQHITPSSMCSDRQCQAAAPAQNTPARRTCNCCHYSLVLGTAVTCRCDSGQAVGPLIVIIEHYWLCDLAGMIGYSAYCPSKFAVRGLAESLRNEVRNKLQQAQQFCHMVHMQPLLQETAASRALQKYTTPSSCNLRPLTLQSM